MSVSRNQTSDLLAIAAMPGLETMAAAFDNTNNDETVAMLVFLAGQWVASSRSSLTAELKSTDTWEQMRASARRVGRELPARAPTHDQLRHFRDRHARTENVHALAASLTPATEPIARGAGLLTAAPKRLHHPDRRNVVYGDGTVFTSSHGGTSGDEQPVPITVVGCRGDDRWQRVVLGVELGGERTETEPAVELFDRIHATYGSDMHAFVYDETLTGHAQHHMTKRGVLPVTPMAANTGPTAAPTGNTLRYLLGNNGKPKQKAARDYLDIIAHDVGEHRCTHAIWALDGVPVSCDPLDVADFDSPVAEQTDLRFDTDDNDEHHLIGTYQVRCPNGELRFEIVLSDTANPSKRAGNIPTISRVRPIGITSDVARTLYGYRRDIASIFRNVDPEHVSQRSNEHFLLDVIGAALRTNAVTWDVHVAHHTPNGIDCAEALNSVHLRRELRRLYTQ